MLPSALRSAASARLLAAPARSVASRSFAAAAPPNSREDDAPPVSLYGIHARYANAAYTAASKQKVLDKVEAELLGIQDTINKNETFRQFLVDPTMSRTDKSAKMETLLKDKASPVTVNLMTTLAGNARLAETSKIVDSYVTLMKAKRGEVEATIISAEKLTKAQMDTVASAMKGQIGEGKKVALKAEVNPSILGGLQIQIGDQFLDLSVASRIDAISRTAV